MAHADSRKADTDKQRKHHHTDAVWVEVAKAGSQVNPLSATNEIAMPESTLATHFLMCGMRSVKFPTGLEVTRQFLVSQDRTKHFDRHLILVENCVIELAVRHLS